MSICLTIYDNTNKVLYNASNLVDDIQITTYMQDNPGKAEFTLYTKGTGNMKFYEGATVSIAYNNIKMFKGYIFKMSRSENVKTIKVTCYDQLRYLKNKDTYVFEGLTSSQIFEKICKDFVLKYKIVDASKHICAPKSNDGAILYDMIKSALDDTLSSTGDWFMIRDNYGVLEHINVTSLQQDYMLGDKSGVIGFTYKTSIDKDTYNQVKLYRDNSETGKRDIYIVNDTVNKGENLKKWGILQYYDKVADGLNTAQIEARAKGILSLYNNTKRELILESLGIPTMCAGATFLCRISNLGDMGVDRYLMVEECTHTFKNNKHTMKLTTNVMSTGEAAKLEQARIAEVAASAEALNSGSSYELVSKSGGTHTASSSVPAVVQVAIAQLGKPYVWGAEGPDSFDCSGLCYYSYQKGIGRTLPRVANDQRVRVSSLGHLTYDTSKLKVGDLCFFGHGNYASHVAMYTGNGKVIQAPKPGDVVKITPLSYFSTFIGGGTPI